MDTKNYAPYTAKESGEIKELKETLQLMMGQMVALATELKKSRIAPEKQICREWLMGDEVERALRISTRTLQTLRDNGTMPCSRFQGKFYYKLKDVKALLENGYGKKS